MRTNNSKMLVHLNLYNSEMWVYLQIPKTNLMQFLIIRLHLKRNLASCGIQLLYLYNLHFTFTTFSTYTFATLLTTLIIFHHCRYLRSDCFIGNCFSFSCVDVIIFWSSESCMFAVCFFFSSYFFVIYTLYIYLYIF